MAARDVPIPFCPTKAISATAVTVIIKLCVPKGRRISCEPIGVSVDRDQPISLRAFDKSDNGDEDDCAYDRGDD